MPKFTKTMFVLCTIAVVMVTAAPLFAAQFLFTPEMTVGVEYSDNIFLTPDNEVDDFITTAGLRLTGELIGRTAGLTLVYHPTYNYFADNSDLDFWRHVGRIYAYKDLRRNTRIGLSSDYLETENPRDRSFDFAPDDPLEGPTIDEDLSRRGRARYRQNTAQARLDHQYGARNTFYTGVSHSFLQDIDTLPGRVVDDHQIWRPSIGMTHWFTQRWGFELDGYYSHRDYEEQNDRQEYTGTFQLNRAFSRTTTGYLAYRHTALYYDEPFDEDYQIYYPSVGFRYEFQEQAFISIGVGYFIQDYRYRGQAEEGFVLDSTLFKRWSFRSGYFDFTGNSGYRIDDSGAQDQGFNIYYQGRLSFLYNLTRTVAATAYGFYRYDDYPNQVPERSDNTIGAGAGLQYQALRWMNIALTYNFRYRDSDIRAEEYTENSVMLTVTMAPATPFRWN